MYGKVKKDVAGIIRKLCAMKSVELLEGAVCMDHVHMYVSISSKLRVLEFMGYLKGKSTLMLFDRHPEFRVKWRARYFGARGILLLQLGI
jgi:putative transposase